MKNVKLSKIGKLILIILFFFITSLNEKVLATENHNDVDISKIDEYMNNELERLNIPGASIAIVKDEKVQYIKGYGISGPNGKEMTSQTPVVLGSVSKSFTALAIMQLVDQGMIQLDHPVQQYIPWFTLANEEASKEITIRHLLNHTSGISEYDGQVAISQGDQSIKKLVESLRDVHLTKGVSETYQYSNLNYSILGLVIEEVTKTPYAEYISSNIFKPLQMENSYADSKEDKNNTIAVGYQTMFGFKMPTEQLNHEANVPHGYLISSAEDMANYMIAILKKGQFKGESVLSKQSINEMHQPSSFIGNDIYYAMGWEVNKDVITHNGWTENTYSRVILDEEYGITLLINSFDYYNSNRYDEIMTNLYNFIKHNEPLKASEENPFMIYIMFDLIIAVAIAYIFFSIYKIFNQQKRKITSFRLFLNVVSLIVFNFLLPFLLLYFVTQVVPLSVATIFAPGIGHALFIIPLFLIIIGVINIGKLVLDKVWRNQKKLHSNYSS
ncbi:serine hydrolase domain-containing protein [Peribacillus asahii]|uniref:Putative penicillin-binding protein n=1 Tax=Peribacillus asahii TaxID=228899 RepID=A0A3Q9RKZ0_9BACI|nr:serine hydrolase domain-containing protein [Peribacillus asahii]AZV41595.1 putative penicillin-binding protein [Peribacillus asahii]USK85949.1 beta-lactamase family protein [Peribacillus asahii]